MRRQPFEAGRTLRLCVFCLSNVFSVGRECVNLILQLCPEHHLELFLYVRQVMGSFVWISTECKTRVICDLF